MPVAYMEPNLNEYNAFSVYTTKTPRERASKSARPHLSLCLIPCPSVHPSVSVSV